MLDTFRRGQRWLTGIFVFVIGGVFVFFLGLGGNPLGGNQPAGEAVIAVGDIVVSRGDYLRERSAQVERFREALGDQFDSQGASSFIDSQTMRRLVDGAIMAHAAQDLGLMVTRAEIQDYIREAADFRDSDGRFSLDAFEGWAEYNFGSQRAFMTLIRQDLLRSKLQRLLYRQPVVSEAEARSAALHRLEGVQIGYVSLDTEHLPSARLLPNDKIEAFLAENDAEVRAVYEQRSDLYQKPQARKARHILFRTERTADEATVAAAKKRAEDALQRIVDGATFQDVALELSEDPGSRAKGGDIGFIVRGGETARELVDAVYELEPGGEIRLVQTDAGFHVVRVDEKREASSMPFEEVGLAIAKELAGQEVALQFAEGLADELADAVRGGQSLEQAAVAAGIAYERSPTLRRRPDGYMPEIGTSVDLMATAFSLTEEDPSSARVFAIANRRILVELIERQQPAEDLLEEEILDTRRGLLSQKRAAIIQTWMDQHRNSVNASGELRINTAITTGS